MNKKRWLFSGFFALGMISLLACKTLKQGVRGEVVRKAGNQMPSPDLPKSAPAGFSTTIYFFEPTHLSAIQELPNTNGLYAKIPKKLLAKAKSDQNGKFKIKLPPGQYSVFIGKGDLYYANISNMAGYINLIEVKPKTFLSLSLTADWDAVY